MEQRHYTVTPASAARQGGGDLPNLVLYGPDGQPLPVLKKAAHQPDSTAADVATMKADFNALLAKLQTAGLMA